ncbi:ATP-binding protein [Candidatus Sumerlaeota bacterium]|nr:ATP-binding protein [Candidatus Sumerlaeota bacterium]
MIELTPEWQAEYLADMRIERARIPRRFLGKTFETFKTGRNADLKAMVQHAKAWVEGFYLDLDDPKEEGNTHKGFLIEGVVGCGKTHIAVAILQAVIRKGFSGLFYNMPDLLSDIRATYSNESSVSESGLLEEINRPDLLVLDDLGAEATKDWINDRLYLIVNRRYDSCKPVIVTTNLTVDDLSEKLGERTVSRLLEMCLPFTPFPKRDYRREILHGDFEPWKTTDRKKTR